MSIEDKLTRLEGRLRNEVQGRIRDHILRQRPDMVRKIILPSMPGEDEITCHQPCVFLSVYDDLGVLIDPGEIAIEGRGRFGRKGSGGSSTHPKVKKYISDIVEDPTWLDLAVLVADMAAKTGDYDHCFIKGVTVDEDENGDRWFEISLGS